MNTQQPYAAHEFKGVHYHKPSGTYEARVHGVYIGKFKTIGDALIAIGTSLNNEIKPPYQEKSLEELEYMYNISRNMEH
jgi:hypothetical protein